MRRVNRKKRIKRFIDDIFIHTPFVQMVILLFVLWIIFSTTIFLSERGIAGSNIVTFGDALYWGIAAFSTAGIADTPVSGLAKALGGIWIIIGSVLFFGAIVATITTYFMKPMQRPHKKIIDTIEYNLEQMDDLTLDELDLLKKTVDSLIINMEKIKAKQSKEQKKE